MPLAASSYDAARCCRNARRLRARHRDNPVRLHRSLRDLFRSQPRPADRSIKTPAAVFADLVDQNLNEPVLHYSRRLELIKQAMSMGIGRFEANLIIATIQHRRRGTPQLLEAAAPDRAAQTAWFATAAAYLLIQSAIIAGGYCLFML